MKVLIACEESQAVCKAFRALGHEAYSCDIQECSGGHPEWHFQGDAIKLAYQMDWDLMIAHPPCTYLSGAGNGYFVIDRYGNKAMERWQKRIDAMRFFMALYNAPIPYICLENPKGFPCSAFRQPDQTIQPFFFGDGAMKTTCLWLKGLPTLVHTSSDNLFAEKTHVDKPEPIYRDKVSGKARYFTDAIAGSGVDAQKLRSKTFPGIASAMATQWSEYILKHKAA